MQTDFYYHLTILGKMAKSGSLSFCTPSRGFEQNKPIHYSTLRALLKDARARFKADLNYSKLYRELAAEGVATVILDIQPFAQDRIYTRDKMIFVVARSPRAGVQEGTYQLHS